MRVGLVGPNGSGKTTLLRLLRGELATSQGEIRRAERLRTVSFDQSRMLDADVTLRRALAPESDSVVYRGSVIHVAGWAARFLFTSEQLDQPVGRLSGGERARVLIAQLMLQPTDLLLLDEPTNDLDIPTLEILEENLMEFAGALVLVTHDRYMLDRVSTIVLGLDGNGAAQSFADYTQWEVWQARGSRSAKTAATNAEVSRALTRAKPIPAKSPPPARKKLSYLEAREYGGIEQRIADAEEVLRLRRTELEDPAIATDATGLLSAQAAVEAALKQLDGLYQRWAELEEKNG